MKPAKLKTCKAQGCKVKFKPFNSLHRACCPACALALVESKKLLRSKNGRKKDKLRLLELKPASYWMKKAQIAFNGYVRARDYGNPCISSGREMDWNAYGGHVDAGHWRSRGSAPHLRFHLHNCHAQSVKDNRYGSGNVNDYRINLIEKIGIEKVEALENNNQIRSFSIDYLKRVATIFNKKTRMLKKRRG